MGEQERQWRLIPPQPCQGALARWQQRPRSRSALVLCRPIPSCSLSAACPIPGWALQAALSPSAHPGAGMRYTECTAPQESWRSQPDKKHPAGTKLLTEPLGAGSWACLFCLSSLRETCPYCALPAARTAQCAGKGQRMKEAMRLLQRLFLSLPCKSEHGQNCTLVTGACQ